MSEEAFLIPPSRPVEGADANPEMSEVLVAAAEEPGEIVTAEGPGATLAARKINVLGASLFSLTCAVLVAMIVVENLTHTELSWYQMRLILAASLFVYGLGSLVMIGRWSERYYDLEYEDGGLLLTAGMLFAAFCLSISFGEVQWPEHVDAGQQVMAEKADKMEIFSTPFCKEYQCSESTHRALQNGETSHTVTLNVPDVHLDYTADSDGSPEDYSIDFNNGRKNLSAGEMTALSKFIESALPLGKPISIGYDLRKGSRR